MEREGETTHPDWAQVCNATPQPGRESWISGGHEGSRCNEQELKGSEGFQLHEHDGCCEKKEKMGSAAVSGGKGAYHYHLKIAQLRPREGGGLIRGVAPRKLFFAKHCMGDFGLRRRRFRLRFMADHPNTPTWGTASVLLVLHDSSSHGGS